RNPKQTPNPKSQGPKPRTWRFRPLEFGTLNFLRISDFEFRISEAAVSRQKPPVHRLSELTDGQLADFFALLAEPSEAPPRDGHPSYPCRFRALRRTVTYMAWADGRHFEECETKWQEGRFYKVRATYGQHERYGPQIDVVAVREVTEEDRADGFDPAE